VAGGEKGFAEMASDDLVSISHRREIDARIPAKQHIDVCRYVLE
jgi:hypothetical protein